MKKEINKVNPKNISITLTDLLINVPFCFYLLNSSSALIKPIIIEQNIIMKNIAKL